MAPTRDQVVAALTSLRADAGHWAHVSYELNLARQAAAGLTLAKRDVSKSGDAVGLTELYSQLQQKMVALLGQGAGNAVNVSNALSASANTYEAEDLTGAQRFTN